MPRARATSRAQAQAARRLSVAPRGISRKSALQSFGCARRVRGIAIRETQARRPKNERELREQVMGRNSLLEDGGRLARSPRTRERIGQLLGGAIAVGREARELAAEPDDLLRDRRRARRRRSSGRVAGTLGRKESQLRFDQPPPRGGAEPRA